MKAIKRAEEKGENPEPWGECFRNTMSSLYEASTDRKTFTLSYTQEKHVTFDPLGGSQQEMVLRQNVSNDVYGTFCVKTEQSREL